MGFSTRSTIDSLVAHCLSRPTNTTPGNPLGWSSVQCRLFQLASVCVATPWNDGSSTSLVPLIKRAAVKACIESNEAVASAAKDALGVCDLFGIPRAPPLLFIHRTLADSSMRMEETAPKMMEDIQAAQEEAVQAREALDQAEQTKLQEKRQRETERKESNKRKRVLQETKNESKKDPPATTSKPAEVTAAQETLTEGSRIATPKPSNQESESASKDLEFTSTESDRPNKSIKSLDKVEVVESQAATKDAVNQDDDDFPDIEIVADGPDSDDD